jgi:8-oxo-dGTP pyrophosphatase MutT (NUDIX family)
MPPPERRDPTSGKPTYTAGALAIVRDDAGRLLWVRRRDSGWWELPGGVIEFGETPAEAVVRETKEESGFDVAVDRLAAVDWKREHADAVLVFECRLVGGAAKPSDETSAVAFFDVAAPPAGVPPKILERVHAVLASPDRAVLRSTS